MSASSIYLSHFSLEFISLCLFLVVYAIGEFFKFTYCHDKFPNTAQNKKKSLITTHSHKHFEQQVGKSTLSSPSRRVLARGAIYEQPIKDLEKLKALKTRSKTLMKQLHEIPHIPNTKHTKAKQQTPPPPSLCKVRNETEGAHLPT